MGKLSEDPLSAVGLQIGSHGARKAACNDSVSTDVGASNDLGLLANTGSRRWTEARVGGVWSGQIDS